VAPAYFRWHLKYSLTTVIFGCGQREANVSLKPNVSQIAGRNMFIEPVFVRAIAGPLVRVEFTLLIRTSSYYRRGLYSSDLAQSPRNESPLIITGLISLARLDRGESPTLDFPGAACVRLKGDSSAEDPSELTREDRRQQDPGKLPGPLPIGVGRNHQGHAQRKNRRGSR